MLRCFSLAPGAIQALRSEEPRWLWCFWLRIVLFVVAVVTSICLDCVIEWTRSVGGEVKRGGWIGWWGIAVVPVSESTLVAFQSILFSSNLMQSCSVDIMNSSFPFSQQLTISILFYLMFISVSNNTG